MSFRETSSSGSLSSSSSVPSTLEEANERKPNNYWTSLVAGGRGRLKSTNTTPKERTITPRAAATYKGSTPPRMTTPAVPHEDLFPEGMTPEEPTLYRVTSRNKSTSLTNVPTAKTSLNEGYSFILYVDKAHVWCWHGKKVREPTNIYRMYKRKHTQPCFCFWETGQWNAKSTIDSAGQGYVYIGDG